MFHFNSFRGNGMMKMKQINMKIQSDNFDFDI